MEVLNSKIKSRFDAIVKDNVIYFNGNSVVPYKLRIGNKQFEVRRI